MPRSTQSRTAAVVLSVLLLAAVPSFAAPSAPAPETDAGLSAPAALLQDLWQWMGSLWNAGTSAGEGDAGARIDGNGVVDLAGARIDGNGDAGARIDGNGLR
jgi:hypothetical protein